MNGRMIIGIFSREDFGKFQFMEKKVEKTTEVLGFTADKSVGVSVVFKEPSTVDDCFEASMLMAISPDVRKAQELTRLACVFLELCHPETPDKETWLTENLARIKPTEKQKTPKVQAVWDNLTVKMQHLGKMGQILIRINQTGPAKGKANIGDESQSQSENPE